METLLVVDDEARIREQYVRILQHQGFTVLEASDAATANDLLRSEPIDLVLLDINMADVDGGDLSELIRSFHKDVKIIVSSVYPLEEQKQRIRSADDYFDKSEGLQSLLKKVKQHTSGETERPHVVLIDDEMKTRVLFSNILEESGFDVIAFADNDKALLYLTNPESAVDLVLLDIEMPEIKGGDFFELTKTFHPRAKVLIFSAHSIEGQKSKIQNADGYIDKSDGKDVLLEMIRHVVNKQASSGVQI